MTQTYDITVIGAGRVGYAVGCAFEAKGYSVLYIDTNQEMVTNLRRNGKNAFLPKDVTSLRSNISFICVPTPTIPGKGVDSGVLQNAILSLGEWLRSSSSYHLVVIKSTVLPGTTKEFIIPQLEHISGKTNGQWFSVCMNPEYLRSSSAIYDAEHPWIVVIGAEDIRAKEMMQYIYQPFQCPIFIVGIREAEAQKYIHNIFNACKISFFNEMRLVCQALGITNVQQILDLVAESAEGSWNPFYGVRNFGPIGGECLPKDLEAFATFTKHQGISTFIIPSILCQNKHYQALQQGRE